MDKHATILNLQVRLTEYLFKIKKFDTNFIIAKIMLDKLTEFPDVSIEEIAYLSNTSPSTVTKFCKKIGYMGFSELREETYVNQHVSTATDTSFKNSKDFYTFHIEQTKVLYDSLYMLFNHEQVKKIASQLLSCKKVSVFTGLHGFAATNLFAELMRPFQITVYEIDRSSEISIIESAFEFSDLIFIISLTGNWVTQVFSQLNQKSINQFSDKSVLISYEKDITYCFMERVDLSCISYFFDSNYISSQSIQAFFVLLIAYLYEEQERIKI